MSRRKKEAATPLPAPLPTPPKFDPLGVNAKKRAWIETFLGVEHIARPDLDDQDAWRAMGRFAALALLPVHDFGPTGVELGQLGLGDCIPHDASSTELITWLYAARKRREEGGSTRWQCDELEAVGVPLREGARLKLHEAAELLDRRQNAWAFRRRCEIARARWHLLFGDLPDRPVPAEDPPFKVHLDLGAIAPVPEDATPAELWRWAFLIADRHEAKLADVVQLKALIDRGIAKPKRARRMSKDEAFLAITLADFAELRAQLNPPPKAA